MDAADSPQPGQPPRSTPPTQDPESVYLTMDWLMRQRRLQQFVLLAIRRKQRLLNEQEAASLVALGRIQARLDRELDRHRDVFGLPPDGDVRFGGTFLS